MAAVKALRTLNCPSETYEWCHGHFDLLLYTVYVSEHSMSKESDQSGPRTSPEVTKFSERLTAWQTVPLALTFAYRPNRSTDDVISTGLESPGTPSGRRKSAFFCGLQLSFQYDNLCLTAQLLWIFPLPPVPETVSHTHTFMLSTSCLRAACWALSTPPLWLHPSHPTNNIIRTGRVHWWVSQPEETDAGMRWKGCTQAFNSKKPVQVIIESQSLVSKIDSKLATQLQLGFLLSAVCVSSWGVNTWFFLYSPIFTKKQQNITSRKLIQR